MTDCEVTRLGEAIQATRRIHSGGSKKDFEKVNEALDMATNDIALMFDKHQRCLFFHEACWHDYDLKKTEKP